MEPTFLPVASFPLAGANYQRRTFHERRACCLLPLNLDRLNPKAELPYSLKVEHVRAAMQEFLGSELFREVGTDPHIKDLTSRGFGVLETPTQITRGLTMSRA